MTTEDRRPEVQWRRLRAEQLRAAARDDAVVILPLGSLEQHGPHLPVEVDSTLGEQVALRIAMRMTEAGTPTLVLPMVWTGVSEHHMSFGGTVTLELSAYVALVEGIVRSVLRHGFRRVVLLNGHGGNENALRSIVDDLTPRLGVPIVQFCYWHAAAEAIAAILETQTALLHACEAETSMMMACVDELVARDRIALAKVNQTPDVSDVVGGGVYMWRAIGSRSGSGVIGNPEAASTGKGMRLFDAISAVLAEKLGSAELWGLPWNAEKLT